MPSFTYICFLFQVTIELFLFEDKFNFTCLPIIWTFWHPRLLSVSKCFSFRALDGVSLFYHMYCVVIGEHVFGSTSPPIFALFSTYPFIFGHWDWFFMRHEWQRFFSCIAVSWFLGIRTNKQNCLLCATNGLQPFDLYWTSALPLHRGDTNCYLFYYPTPSPRNRKREGNGSSTHPIVPAGKAFYAGASRDTRTMILINHWVRLDVRINHPTHGKNKIKKSKSDHVTSRSGVHRPCLTQVIVGLSYITRTNHVLKRLPRISIRYLW